jgi:hypothetical protein
MAGGHARDIVVFPRRAGEEDADCFHGERKVNKKNKNYIMIGRSYWGELIIGDPLWHLPQKFQKCYWAIPIINLLGELDWGAAGDALNVF